MVIATIPIAIMIFCIRMIPVDTLWILQNRTIKLWLGFFQVVLQILKKMLCCCHKAIVPADFAHKMCIRARPTMA